MQRLLFATMFGLGCGLVVASAGAQTISDRIRDPSRKPGSPVTIGVLGEPTPLSVEGLTNGSDLVLEARISWLKTYINVADTAVLTDYAIQPIRILAGTVPGPVTRPGVATPLILSTYGGEIVRDGVTIRAENHNLKEALNTNVSYLLFLKRLGKAPGTYVLYNVGVFELSDNALRPLASQGGDLYRQIPNVYSEVLARVTTAARAK
jgi:hypothetical protein